MEYREEIYNFQHDLVLPGKIRIDNFLIEVTQEHCDNAKKLEKGLSHSFQFDEKNGYHVNTTPPIHGEYVVTAVVTCNPSDVKSSVLYEDLDSKTNIDDLCAVLSALTGRMVFLKKNLESRPPVKRFDGMVSPGYLSHSNISLKGLEKLKEDGLSIAFLNICYLPFAGDLLALSAYANCTLNVIYEVWCSKNANTKYPQEKNVKQAMSNATEIILNKLVEVGIDEESCRDIVARIRFETSPSAIYKITKFLLGVGIIEGVDADIAEKHIKWINTVRNRLTHTGGLPRDKSISHEQMLGISVHISFIVVTLAQWYFATEYLGIMGSSVKRDELALKEYFSSGIFRGKKVFEETYEEYLARLVEEWVSQNNGIEA